MNKNLFIYSFKYLAVLLALVTFSSCERDEFTEEQALELERQRNAIEQGNLDNDVTRLNDVLRLRQEIEALTRANSGGKVLYSVVVVPGSDAAFASGRIEEVEGLNGATVTVSQFTAGSGDGTAALVQEVPTTEAGVASFELYSGEVTVNIRFADETYGTVNYTANLTPDGGVANGATVAVSNVIPVFENPTNPPVATPIENFATIKGFAFSETNIVDNNVEESVADSTKVRAFIDVNTAFMAKYINPANGTDEGTNINGNITKSGLVRRIAYEDAVSTTGFTDDQPTGIGTARGGAYEVKIAGTASGLPIKMKFDDFAANRTYVFGNGITQTGSSDGDFGRGTKRFLYTQNTEMVGGMAMADPTPFVTGQTDLAENYTNVNFRFVNNVAQAEATIAGGDRVSAVSVSDGGYYYEAPTVTIGTSASGVTATATANLVEIPASATGEAADARDRGLKMVGSVTITSGGSGYDAAPSVTFTRKSYTGRVAGAPVANGTGAVAAPSSKITYIRVMDGGFGMTPAGVTGSVTGVGAYTGVTPAVVFNNNNIPTGGSLASANAIVDESVGTVTEVQIVNGGEGYDGNNLDIIFNYGEGATVSATNNSLGGTAAALFRVGANGELLWNTSAAGERTLTSTGGEVTFIEGTNYTFVPSVTVTGLTAPTNATLPTFVATVNGGPGNGNITSIEIQGATSGWGATGDEFNGTININANPDAVAISAEGFTTGGSIDTYTLTNYGTTNDVYQSAVTDAGEDFDFLTTLNDGLGTIVDKDDNPVAPADYAENSDFIVVFDNPTTGTSNAWGYPIFDNGSVVGILFAPGTGQGIGYTSVPASGVPFWIIPADLASTPNAALAQYKGTNGASDANASASTSLSGGNLTITFTEGGLGYAVRPEFRLRGGNQSAEDLAAINTAINGAIRSQLNFDEDGRITNTSLSYTGALPFSAADLATNPVSVEISVARLEEEFNAAVNGATRNSNGTVDGTGILVSSASNGTSYSGDFSYYIGGNEVPAMTFFSDAAATAGLTGTYVIEPEFSLGFGDNNVNTGASGFARLNPSAMINKLELVTFGSVTSGTIDGVPVTSFFYQLNDASYNPMGERFRTIGGASSFDVYSGMTYIRDVNYGTGIELE